MAGAAAGGLHAGGAGGGGSSGSGNGGGGAGSGSGGGGTNATCQMIKAEYMAELDKQLACNTNAGSQCGSKAEAAPGCECRIFVQPSDPFALEHLSNIRSGWFDADCTMPVCPAKCSTAAAGICQAGRCVSP